MGKTLSEYWRVRRQEICNTTQADIGTAERTVRELYLAISRPEPKMIWIANPTMIEVEWVAGQMPLTNLPDLLFWAAWYKFSNPEQLVAPLGYDRANNNFGLTHNYQLILRNARLRGPRRMVVAPRPPWLRDMSNFVTQFDAASIALWQYGVQEHSMDRAFLRIGKSIIDLLDTTFGIIMFADVCLLIDRPSVITLDDTNLLSSTTTCALQWRDQTKVYAANGVLVREGSLRLIDDHMRRPDHNHHLWWHLAGLHNASERVAVIDMIGWEKFFDLVPKSSSHRINQDDFGELWRIICGNQTMMVVRVTNHSPEPDGTYKKFVIPVDPMLRPLPNPRDPNGRVGAPQSLNALNAVASTYGMTGERYAAVLGEQS